MLHTVFMVRSFSKKTRHNLPVEAIMYRLSVSLTCARENKSRQSFSSRHRAISLAFEGNGSDGVSREARKPEERKIDEIRLAPLTFHRRCIDVDRGERRKNMLRLISVQRVPSTKPPL